MRNVRYTGTGVRRLSKATLEVLDINEDEGLEWSPENPVLNLKNDTADKLVGDDRVKGQFEIIEDDDLQQSLSLDGDDESTDSV